MSSSSADSTPSPPHKRAKKSGFEDCGDDEKMRLTKADREYSKILATFNGFYLNRWSEAAAKYIEAIARCTNSNKTVVKAAAEFAVASLNLKKKTNSDDVDLRLIRVLRSNYLMCGRYYITLEASDRNFYEAELVLKDLDKEEEEEEEEEEDIGICNFDFDQAYQVFNDDQVITEKVIFGEKDYDDDVEIIIDEDDDDEDDNDDKPDLFGGFIECYYFKLEMMRIALHYPKVDKTYGPRCAS